jgi:hypothetical protein
MALCAGCGFRLSRGERLVCSVVCRLLAGRGLGWRCSPYRIIEVSSGQTVASGLLFDVTAKMVVAGRPSRKAGDPEGIDKMNQCESLSDELHLTKEAVCPR